MSNKLRILTRNVARATGVTASSTSGAYAASNLLTFDKTKVWRAPGTSATLSGSSATLQTASSLHQPHCNYSPTATGKLTLYNDQAKTSVARVVDTRLICPEPAAEIDGWAAAQAANAYDQGGGAWARMWFPETAFRAWSFDISDASNAQGALEAADLFIGPAWSPLYDIEPGGAGTVQRDTSEQIRTAAGSLLAQAGFCYDEMTLDLAMLNEADRKAARALLRAVRRRVPFIASLWPDDNDAARERAHSIYGLLTEDAEMALDGPDNFGTKLKIAQI